MPPWAQAVAASLKPRLAIKMTGWFSAMCRATVNPANPAPIMRTGNSAWFWEGDGDELAIEGSF